MNRAMRELNTLQHAKKQLFEGDGSWVYICSPQALRRFERGILLKLTHSFINTVSWDKFRMHGGSSFDAAKFHPGY